MEAQTPVILQALAVDAPVIEATATALSLPVFATSAEKELIDLFCASEGVKQSSRNTYRRQLKEFFKWLKITNTELAFCRKASIVAFKDYITNKGLAPLTIGGYLTAVRKFFAFAEENGLAVNIAKGVKSPKKKNMFIKQHLSLEEIKRLLQKINKTGSKREKVMASLMLHTGLRTIEVSRLDIGDLTQKGGRHVLKVWRKGKLSKEDFVIISDKLHNDLQSYIEAERRSAPKNAPLFVSSSHNNTGGRLSTRTISAFGKRYLRAIGLTGTEYSTHSFRHSTAVQILKLTNDITAVQAVLGHSSPATSQIYTESIKEELRLEKATELLLDSVF